MAQAKIIDRLNSEIERARVALGRAENKLHQASAAAKYYFMLQAVIADHPVLQVEWERFVNLTKFCLDESQPGLNATDGSADFYKAELAKDITKFFVERESTVSTT